MQCSNACGVEHHQKYNCCYARSTPGTWPHILWKKNEFTERQRQRAKKGQKRVLSPEEEATNDAIKEEEAKRPKVEVPLTESALENMLQ